MKNGSLKSSLSLLLIAFVLLVVISVGATWWGIEAQKKDARVINLAGRQRMLVQQIVRLALEFERDGRREHLEALRQSAGAFESTQAALRYGGATTYWPGEQLPPTPNPKILAQLEQVSQTWDEFHRNLNSILTGELTGQDLDAAIASVQALSPIIIDGADGVVRLYEAAAEGKVDRLRRVQTAFLVSALILLGIGARLVHRSLLDPLDGLSAAAGRIGAGDLTTPVQVSGPSEITVLADTFETMRAQLLSSQAELLTWAGTLEKQVAQRTSELDALYTVSREISSKLDIHHVLESVTGKARHLLSGETAFLCLASIESQTLQLQAASGPGEAVHRSSSPANKPFIGRVMASNRALQCGLNGCQGHCEIMSPAYQASHLAAPLRIGDRVIGVLCIGSAHPDCFPAEAEGLLTKLAQAAAIALENARLYEQAERTAMLEERQRIAAEMHDGLAQTIGYLQMMVDLARMQIEQDQEEKAIATLQRGRRAVDQATLEIRRAIESLQEEFPLSITLQDQLSGLVAELGDQKAQVEWIDSACTPLVLAPQDTEQVLRITREALLNACSHSRAKNITVRLNKAGCQGVVHIQDDGEGFDPQQPPATRGARLHFGLKIMHARAARLGGQVEIQSAPGHGTRVTLTWPLTEHL